MILNRYKSCYVLFIVCLSIVSQNLLARSDSALQHAAASVLTFDQSPTVSGAIDFDQDDPLYPTRNDFEIVQFAAMSNELGERWALMTIKNTSAGQRFLKNKNLVATFADGSQSYAAGLDEMLKGKQQLTKTIFFGYSKFPILSVVAE